MREIGNLLRVALDDGILMMPRAVWFVSSRVLTRVSTTPRHNDSLAGETGKENAHLISNSSIHILSCLLVCLFTWRAGRMTDSISGL